MKNRNGSIVRIVSAIVLGLILVLWPSDALLYLVRVVGGLFLVVGLVSLAGFLLRNKTAHPDARFPIDATGSMLFGLVLTVIPNVFVGILMYLLAGLLILASIQQIVLLFSFRRVGRVPFGFYIVPILIMSCSLVIIFQPLWVAETTLILLGVAALVYGVSELINLCKFRKPIELSEVQDIETQEIEE